MKKIKYLLLSLLFLPIFVHATSGKITVSANNQVVLGNKVTVTVKLSAGASWEMDLSYDKSYLQFVSGGGEAGGTSMVNTSTGKPNRTYTYTFKTLKTGSATVKVGSYYVVDDNFNTVSITSSPKTIKIITQAELEASYSKDNNLKSLAVDGFSLTPEFSKDTLEYSVTVPENTKKLNIKATPNDGKASVHGTGEVDVNDGVNNLEIVVRAENGSEKTYKIAVNVIDENPIEVEANNIKYNVVKIRDYYKCLNLYEEKEIEINSFKIPACYNENADITLVGLKNSEGNINNFIYDNGNYKEYREVIGTSLRIIPISYKDELKNMTKSDLVIEEVTYNAFKYDDNSKNYVVYGLNIETGKKDFYLYDSVNKSFSLFDKEYLNGLNTKLEKLLYVIIIFGVSLFLAIICLLVSISKKKPKVKKEKEVVKEDIGEENIVEEKKEKKKKKDKKKDKKE